MWIALAWAHVGAPERIVELTEAIQTEPTAARFVERARAHADLADLDAALIDLDRAEELGGDVALERARVTRDPAHLEGIPGLDAERLRAELSSGADAVAAYDRVLEQAVTVDVVVARAEVARQLDPAEAARGVERGLDALGPSVVLQELAAACWLDAGEPGEALRHIDALQIARRSPDVLLMRFRATGDAQDVHDAVALARERLDEKPSVTRELELRRALDAEATLPDSGGCDTTGVGPWWLAALMWRRRCS